MMLFLCSIVSLSFVMYSGDEAVSMFNCSGDYDVSFHL